MNHRNKRNFLNEMNACLLPVHGTESSHQYRITRLLTNALLVIVIFCTFCGRSFAQLSQHTASPMVSQPTNPPGTPGPVSGPASVQQGTTSSTYTVTAATYATSYTWSLSTTAAGTISGSGTSATVTWKSSFSGYVTINCTAVNSLGSTPGTGLSVNVVANPTATISPTAFAINYNTSPGTISVTSPVDMVTYSYQWQSSANNSTWTTISGATGTSYTPPNLTASIYYRALLSNNNTDAVTYSNACAVTVYAQLTSGTATPASQTLNYNSVPATLSCTTPGGGTGTYFYQWQSSPNNSTWSNISGATSLTYAPPALTTTNYYRLVSTSNGVSVNSNALTVTVYPQLVPGTAAPYTQTINYNTAPSTLSSAAVTGGSGTYTYQWQSSPDGTTFSNISGATALSYLPPAIKATTYYRLLSTSNGANAYSNTLTVTVYPQLVSGTATPYNQTINYNAVPSTLTSAAVTGGSGTYTYQWQSSPDGTNFSNIANANTLSYTPPALTATTYYRLLSTSNGANAYSNTLTVTVYPQLVPGTATPYNQTINYNAVPSVLTSAAATGGSGTYTYQWQSSPDGTTFSNITNATNLSYTPSALTATTYYRLLSTSNGANVYSNTLTISVYPQLVPGNLTPATQSMLSGTVPSSITSALATGGSGTYTYQWQSSADNVAWVSLSGATTTTLPTPTADNTAYYRLAVTSNGATAYSSSSAVLVTDCFQLNTATPSASNYVITSTFRTGGITAATDAQIAAMGVCDVNQEIQYLDGLGRLIQDIQIKASPTGKDLVKPKAYDANGREAVKYLPYTVSNTQGGAYQATALTGAAPNADYAHSDQYQFYQSASANYVTTGYPLAPTGYEPSPLNRVVEQASAGQSWQFTGAGSPGSSNHTSRTDYSANDQTSTFSSANSLGSKIVVLYTTVINTSTLSERLVNVSGATYQPGTLSVSIQKNENWQPANGCVGTTEEYKDKTGNIVLRRTYNATGSGTQELSTYYVYDDLGNLAFVLPPAAMPDNGLPGQATLDGLCYQYHYDQRNRLVEKKLPGKGWEYIVYNTLGQVVATQDTIQRSQNPQQASFIKYDARGRQIMSGTFTFGEPANANYRSVIQTAVNGEAAFWETRATGAAYTNTAYPTANLTTLKTNYYDNYSLPNFPSTCVAPQGASTNTTTLLTATVTSVLNSPSTVLWTVHYYDQYGRRIQTYTQHFLSGTASVYNYDVLTSTYNFINQVTANLRSHYNTTNTTTPVLTINNSYIYDQAGRKRQTFESINGAVPTLIAQMDYNELGQFLTKHLHQLPGGSFAQDIAYNYNERGWPLSAASALFKETLQYNSVAGISGITPVAQFNGNLASETWVSPQSPSGNSYTYSYDSQNRLLGGIATNGNTEQNVSYDYSGNITALQRSSAGTTTDNLAYSYLSGSNPTNQLQTIIDNSSSDVGVKHGTLFSYQYDGNGNMVNDNSKGLAVSYNLLNLPQVNTLSSGTVSYVYNADGKKLRKVSTLGTGSSKDYIDGIVYVNGVISYIQTEEGKAINSGGGNYNYDYALKDHLGNTRVSFNIVSNAANVVQQDDYYPFGMDISVGTITSPQNYDLYNGKELQAELVQYDYGARFYDPVIGRWTTPDPQAEQNRRFSPYNYCVNNPIRNIDPDGRQWIWNRFTQQFRWDENVYQQSDLTDPNDRFVGINYLYTGDNGMRSFLSADGHNYNSTEMLNVPTYQDFAFNPKSYYAMTTFDANGNPEGYIVPIPVFGPRHWDPKLGWDIGSGADVAGYFGAAIFREGASKLPGPIAVIAGGYPALVNILNGVGNDDDLIAVGNSLVGLVTAASPVGWEWDLAAAAVSIVNDIRTRPTDETMPVEGQPSSGEEGDQFNGGNNNNNNNNNDDSNDSGG